MFSETTWRTGNRIRIRWNQVKRVKKRDGFSRHDGHGPLCRRSFNLMTGPIYSRSIILNNLLSYFLFSLFLCLCIIYKRKYFRRCNITAVTHLLMYCFSFFCSVLQILFFFYFANSYISKLFFFLVYLGWNELDVLESGFRDGSQFPVLDDASRPGPSDHHWSRLKEKRHRQN